MKKIVFVIPTMRMGGAEKSLVTLLKSLDKEKVEVDLFLFEEGGILQSEVPEWVNIIGADDVTKAMLLEWRWYAKKLILHGHFIKWMVRTWLSFRYKYSNKRIFEWGIIKKYIKKTDKEYDAAIGYLEGNTDFFVIDKIDAKKKIGWIHTDFSKRKILEEEIDYYKKFDTIITISELCKKSFIEQIPELDEKTFVLENIVLKEEVEKKAKEPIGEKWNHENTTHLVSVGRLEYEKGFDIAVQVAKMLRSRNVKFCWHIYGEGSMREELERSIDENNLKECFILEGIKPNPYPYVKKADIIVQPSRYEGKSIVLDEAKMLGKAIVVTNYASVFDQVKDGVTGIITEIDAESIADGIEKIINDKRIKEYLEENTRKEPNNSCRVVQKFYSYI